MPLSKEASIRYNIIDRCISDKQRPFPSMVDLIAECEQRLGKKFSVSTIQKDIRDMKEDAELGFLAPIKFSKSRNGYYYSDPDFTIRKISLKASELEALDAATEILSNYIGSSRVSQNFSHAVSKIFAVAQERQPEKKSARHIIQLDYSPNHKGLEHFELLLKAARERIPVCFVHYSYSRRDFRSVIVHPVLLKEFQNNWYIVGYSEQHKEVRTFGLDRIYEPLLLKRNFSEPDSQVLDEYLIHVYGVYPFPGEPIQKIEFQVNPVISDYLHAHPIHESQERTRESDSGAGIFTLELIPSVELLNFFLSHTGDLEVTKPKWIRDRLENIRREAR